MFKLLVNVLAMDGITKLFEDISLYFGQLAKGIIPVTQILREIKKGPNCSQPVNPQKVLIRIALTDAQEHASVAMSQYSCEYT